MIIVVFLRAVFILGIPFPNTKDPVVFEEFKYFSKTYGWKEAEKSEYLQYKAMKTVNQTIGRCLRHAKDYASIFLVDSRYCQDSILKKLPHWIPEPIIPSDTLEYDYSAILYKFYNQKD